MAPEEPTAPTGDRLDIRHLAELANLPLTDAEAEELTEACSHVLEAFSLEEIGGDELPGQEQATFEDVAEPWPEEGVDALLDQVPRLEGREIRP